MQLPHVSGVLHFLALRVALAAILERFLCREEKQARRMEKKLQENRRFHAKIPDQEQPEVDQPEAVVLVEDEATAK
ncbi:hypothetical protein NDU88_004853 [Pleurodeles waltl]|uniref:Secreted protein n=1 Tax=Pleurodeles waltl TaxID=8319 RepID=A0AAV7L2M2_PLEWA|nr:hypothetical protein NDU88_004853 [Pleurodeles waltl]